MTFDAIPLTKPHFTDDEITSVKSVLDSGWVSQGKKCEEFETLIRTLVCGTKYAHAVSNCTAALFLSMKALAIVPGDEVIVGDFSYPATALAVVACGATPRFCDVNAYTYNIDCDKIESLINDNTRAIIPVHTFGNPCNMDRIEKIASENNLKIIEDAACACGAIYRGFPIGSWGDVACFSFHARKGITTGEGGAITTDSQEIYDKIVRYSTFGVGKTFGRKDIPSFSELGFNYKMSDITAAIGVAQIKKLRDIIERKKQLVKQYTDLIESRYMYSPQLETPFGHHAYQSFVVTAGTKRDKVLQHLKTQGIEATIGTYAQHMQPVFETADKCPTSHRLFRETISLPLYYDLTEEQIHYIVEAMHECH